MEATVLSLGKSVVIGALSYAKSAGAGEVASRLGVQRDQAFITDELEMMQAFLMAAHDEPEDKDRVVRVWVKQVRDVAYEVEDSLQEFAVRLHKQSWWRIARTLLDRRLIGKQMRELRAKVEDVSRRNKRYRLIIGDGSGSKPSNISTSEFPITGVMMSGTEEARRQLDKAKMDLIRLINSKKDDDLRVIALWRANGDLGGTSIVKKAYEDLKMHKRFECFAWIKLVHPVNPTDYLRSILRQFYVNSLQGTTTEFQDLRWMELTKENDLVDEFKRFVSTKSYLIVLKDIHTIEEWDCVKVFLSNNKKGSRIIISTEQVEVASLCVRQWTSASDHKQLHMDQALYAFYEKGLQDGADATEAGSSLNIASTSSSNSADYKSLTHTETAIADFKEYEQVGREKEKSDIIKLILSEDSQQLDVISVWGMGGLGKTTLVRDVYQNQHLSVKFRYRACVTIMHPFNCDELIQSLARQLDAEDYENKEETGLAGGRTKPRLQRSLTDILEGKKYLIVLDDLSSATEWDSIMQRLPARETASRIIVTTRSENIARHCSKKQENIYKLQILGYEDGLKLFMEKVFHKITYLNDEYPELVEQANLILKKCDGLPLAIVTIGGFLANQPKTALEWMKLNDHISAELEMNPELERIAAVLNKSYDGLPFHLKSCMLYFSIFPQDDKVSRRRLVRRWIAEGYSRELRGKSSEEIAESYFMELISRSMILPSQESIHSRRGVDSCQVHDLIREIGISKSAEDNLVFTLEEGCGLNSRGTIRHLAISSSWKGDQCEFKSIVDMSCIRSLTVFGKWRPFFMSEKMRLLRVLDLEGTSGLVDHHLTGIGKLLHLRYLSLRGCDDIYHLPDSLGNLRQLQTLDVTYTSIIELPRTIIKLSKLEHIRAGGIGSNDGGTHETCADTLCTLALSSMAFCVGCCAPQVLKEVMDMDGDPNRRDVCTACCCNKLPSAATRQSPTGVEVPRGTRRLQALGTMGVVNVSGSRGKAVLNDLKSLTRLRKLRVTGINKKNSQELCSALSKLSCLESLLVRSEGSPGLCGCLDALSSPSKKLQSLKLYGNLVRLPEWIEGLRNLVKMELRSSRILEVDAVMQVLGNLPNLAILRLLRHSFAGEELRFTLNRDAAFPSLTVLELSLLDRLESVEFEQGAAPKIELLQFRGWRYKANTVLFAGLPCLPSLKEVLLKGRYEDGFVDDLRARLAGNPNRPVLKLN
nr:NBS-LRR disease resistance protein [Dasypyrum villosum]